MGRELPNKHPGLGAGNNLVAAIILVKRKVHDYLGAQAGERDLLTEEECKRAHDHMDEIVDQLAAELRAGEG